MRDLSEERIRQANRALLMCLFFAALTLTTFLLISVFVVLTEAETNADSCDGAAPRTSILSAAGGRETSGGIFDAVLTASRQDEGAIACTAEPVQRPVIRDGWSRGRVVLVVNYSPEKADACERHVFVSTGRETAGEFFGQWVTGQPGDRIQRDAFEEANRLSSSYGRELASCGDLIIYGLSYPRDAGIPGEQQEKILSGLAELLSENPGLKLRIVGHRARSGDVAGDHAMSSADAKAVKRALIERYGTEAKRLFAEGMGSEEPIAGNDTETGRAANSRIEIVSERSCLRAKETIVAGQREAQPSASGLASLGPRAR